MQDTGCIYSSSVPKANSSMTMTSSELQSRFGDALYPASLIMRGPAALWMHRVPNGKKLVVLAPGGHPWLSLFDGSAEAFDDERTIKWCPLTYANAYALMGVLSNLKPVPL